MNRFSKKAFIPAGIFLGLGGAVVACSPLASSISKNVAEQESIKPSAPFFFPVFTVVTSVGEDHPKSKSQEFKHYVAAPAGNRDEAFEMNVEKLLEFRERHRAQIRLQLPDLSDYEAAEIVVRLNLSETRIEEFGLNRFLMTIRPDKTGGGSSYLFEAASGTQSEVLELIQAHVQEIVLVLRRVGEV